MIPLFQNLYTYFQIGNTTYDAQIQTEETWTQIDGLGNKLKTLQTRITDNEFYTQRVIKESQEIYKEAHSTSEKSEQLLNEYQTVKAKLANKLGSVDDSKRRAADLFDRTLQLMSKIRNTESEIDTLRNSSLEEDIQNLKNEIQHLIVEMGDYTHKIEERAMFYKTCT